VHEWRRTLSSPEEGERRDVLDENGAISVVCFMCSPMFFAYKNFFGVTKYELKKRFYFIEPLNMNVSINNKVHEIKDWMESKW